MNVEMIKRQANSKSLLTLAKAHSPPPSRVLPSQRSTVPSTGLATRHLTPNPTRSSFPFRKASVPPAVNTSFNLPHSRSFCLVESNSQYDLRGQRLSRELSGYLAQARPTPKDYCKEIISIATKHISAVQNDRKDLSSERFSQPYTHPLARRLFKDVREKNALQVQSLASKHPSVLCSVDQVQQTPLHIAAKTNSLELIAFMMNQGLSCDAQDMVGRSPFKIAKRKRLQVLTNYMNQFNSARRRSRSVLRRGPGK